MHGATRRSATDDAGVRDGGPTGRRPDRRQVGDENTSQNLSQTLAFSWPTCSCHAASGGVAGARLTVAWASPVFLRVPRASVVRLFGANQI